MLSSQSRLAGPLHQLVDSTGVMFEVKGEWKARKHGGPKRRLWHKIHIVVDEKTLEIRAGDFTTKDVVDVPILPEALYRISTEQEITTVTDDGASDRRKRHCAIAARGAAAITRRQRNVMPWMPALPERSHETKPFQHQRAWGGRSGDDSAGNPDSPFGDRVRRIPYAAYTA